jgi:alpha-L-fucosidase
MLKLTVDPDPGYAVREVFFTQKGSTLYAILPKWPDGGSVILKGINVAGKKVTFLETGDVLKVKKKGTDTEVKLPAFNPNKIKSEYAYVIKIS